MTEEKSVVVENKNPLTSRTLWVGLFTSVAPFIPKFEVWWTNNPKVAAIGLGVLIIVMRLVTKQKLSFDIVLDIFKSKK